MTLDAVFPGFRWAADAPPDVYELPPDAPGSSEVRMDVAAFVGLAERGPFGEAVVVESWEEFLAKFGRPGAGRLLPESVHAFFVNGGRRCVVVRAGPRTQALSTVWALPGIEAGDVSSAALPSDSGWSSLLVEVSSPGAWGDEVGLHVSLSARRLARDDGAFHPSRAPRPYGLLRAHAEDGTTSLHYAAGPVSPPLPAATLRVEELTVTLEVRVGAYRERREDLGFHPEHSRYLLDALTPFPAWDTNPARPLASLRAVEWQSGSTLTAPSRRLLRGDGVARPVLRPAASLLAHGETCNAKERPLRSGVDAAVTTGRGHMLDPDYQDLRDRAGVTVPSGERNLPPGAPVLTAILEHDRRHPSQPVSLINLPDLVHPDSRARFDTRAQATAPRPRAPRFGPCAAPPPFTGDAPERDHPRLEIIQAADEQEALQAQVQVAEWCAAHPGHVVVVDLPPDLDPAEILAWRRALGRTPGRAALYAPFLRVPPAGDPRGSLHLVPPGGAVCGAIARSERERGVQAAPANLQVVGPVALASQSFPPAGVLYHEGINAIRRSELGWSLLSERTTADDAQWRHLSTRRLLDYLGRQLALDSRWAVFEPSSPTLWEQLRLSLAARLDRLFAAGAFSGRTPEASYFIRCGLTTMTQADLDSGRLIVLVGVAPSVPTEFIVFQLILHEGSVELRELRD